MLCRLPLRSHLARATAAPLRLRGFRPRAHFPTCHALRRIHRLPNNRPPYLKRQNLLRMFQLVWRVWACLHNRIRPVAEHARVRSAESQRLSVFLRAQRKSFTSINHIYLRSSRQDKGSSIGPSPPSRYRWSVPCRLVRHASGATTHPRHHAHLWLPGHWVLQGHGNARSARLRRRRLAETLPTRPVTATSGIPGVGRRPERHGGSGRMLVLRRTIRQSSSEQQFLHGVAPSAWLASHIERWCSAIAVSI
jgi:hypothetical protein